MDRQSKVAAVVLGLFALPFCGFGMAAVVGGIRHLRQGEPANAAGLVLFGLVFSCIGFGLLALLVLGPRKLARLRRMQAEHASEPWLLRADWAEGRAVSKTRATLNTALVLTVAWNLISWPIAVLVPRETYSAQPKTLLVWIFPAIGLLLLVWTYRELSRWIEFGKTYFQMGSVPLVIGREFQGTIQARFPHLPDHGIQLKLSCVNRVITQTGNSQSTSERILWREEKTVPSAELLPGPDAVGIPVSFHIPLDARATDSSDPRDCVLWLLEADADVPGVDYKDIFELPVFRTRDTPAAPPAGVFSSPYAVASQRPAHPTIVVRPAQNGGTEFYFPPARNKGFAFGTTVFSVLWSGMVWLMLSFHILFIFPAIFGLFDLVMIYICLELWLGTSHVIVRSGEIEWRKGLLGSGRNHAIASSEVSDISLAITAQEGGATGTPYYSIQMTQADGKKISLGNTLRSKDETEWLVSEMKRLAGLMPKAMAAGAR